MVSFAMYGYAVGMYGYAGSFAMFVLKFCNVCIFMLLQCIGFSMLSTRFCNRLSHP